MSQSPMDNNSLYPIAVLIDELKSEDVRRRLNSVKNLHTIAIALGPERTRMELLHFINDLVDDDDEVLLELASSLSNFIDYVGGPAYASSILPPLEILCTVEEGTVRDKALEGIKKIISQLKPKEVDTDVFTMVKRLIQGDWFTSKVSGLSLIPSIYPMLSSSSQQEIISIYKKCVHDEVPQVRRTVGSILKELIPLMPKISENDIFGVFNIVNKDEQDSVRLMGVENCIALTKTIPFQKISTHLLPLIKSVAEDKSWRLRFMMADKITELCANVDDDTIINHFSGFFANFLQDQESEVRTAAAAKFADFSKKLDTATIMKKIIPGIKKIATDPFQYVRKALAENLLAICPLIGATNTSEHVIPIFLTLLKDDSADVRIPIFKNLDALNKVIGVETLSQSIIPAVASLAQDKKNWRIRLTVIEYFPILAAQMGETLFNDKFLDICLDWLNDQVYAIREKGIAHLAIIIRTLGPTWGEKYVLPKVMAFQNNPNYLYRLTTLFGVNKLSEVLPPSAIEKVLPQLCSMTNDKIANIKFNLAKSLKMLSTKLSDSQSQNLIKNALNQLAGDQDFDVRYYATKSFS